MGPFLPGASLASLVPRSAKVFSLLTGGRSVIDSERVLRDGEIVLRPLAVRDLRRCTRWFSNPKVTHFLARESKMTLAEEERWFREYERKPDEQVFAIELDRKHIGNVGLHRVNRVHRKAQLGILIGEPSLWSKGYGTMAIRLVLRYAFDTLQLNKISLDVLEYNHRAIRSYEKVGFRREGIQREDLCKDGRFFHVIRMSILAREMRETSAGAERQSSRRSREALVRISGPDLPIRTSSSIRTPPKPGT